ncbi:MAG: AsmA family protein [Endomicrobium sp.]|jgi:hypothetical protein|nr:AsmA family protein [Endomicrobium sp.]
MKKIIITISAILIVFIIVFIMIPFLLKAAFPPEKIKTVMEAYTKSEFDREINFDKITFIRTGMQLHNFTLSKKGGFDKGVFIKTKKLSFKVKLLPLLIKNISLYRIEAGELFMDIIKKDGMYNVSNEDIIKKFVFDGLKNGKNKKIKFAISEINITKSQIQYFSKDKNIIYTISDLSAVSKNVHLSVPFETKLKFILSYNKETERIEVPFEALLIADLQNMNPLNASIEIKSLDFHYNDTKFNVKAKAENFFMPNVSFSAEADTFTQNTLKDIAAACMPFKFNKVKINSEFKVDFINKAIIFKSLDLTSGNSVVKSSGSVGFGQKNKSIDFKQTLSFNIGEILGNFEKWFTKFSVNGTVNAATVFKNNTVTAQAWSNDISVNFEKTGISASSAAVKSAFKVDFLYGKINFSNLDFSILNFIVNSNGIYDFKKNNYEFFINSSFGISDLSLLFGRYIKDYSPQGKADISFKFSNSGIKGSAVLKDAAVKYLSVFDIDKLNGTIVFNSINDIKTNNMTGKLNGEKFTLLASYFKDLQNIMLSLNFKANKFYFPSFPPKKEADKNILEGKVPAENRGLPYILHLKMSTHANFAEISHIKTKSVNINADLKNITHRYDRIKGYLSVNADNVVIENIEEFANKNTFAKSVIYPLNEVREAAANIGINIFGKKEMPEGKKRTNFLKFDKVESKSLFNPGFIHMEKLKLSSAGSYVNAAGGIGLQSHFLNMRLIVGAVTGESFVIKLDGTLDKPKTRVDLAGSIFTVIDAIQKAVK